MLVLLPQSSVQTQKIHAQKAPNAAEHPSTLHNCSANNSSSYTSKRSCSSPCLLSEGDSRYETAGQRKCLRPCSKSLTSQLGFRPYGLGWNRRGRPVGARNPKPQFIHSYPKPYTQNPCLYLPEVWRIGRIRRIPVPPRAFSTPQSL